MIRLKIASSGRFPLARDQLKLSASHRIKGLSTVCETATSAHCGFVKDTFT
jgi:hypothetical protein